MYKIIIDKKPLTLPTEAQARQLIQAIKRRGGEAPAEPEPEPNAKKADVFYFNLSSTHRSTLPGTLAELDY